MTWGLMLWLFVVIAFHLESLSFSKLLQDPHYEELWAPSTDYEILKVTPTRISNNGIVSVYYRSKKPNALDFISAVSPADTEVDLLAPVMYGNCASDPGYLDTGEGRLDFQFTNLRQTIGFYYNTGGYNNTQFFTQKSLAGTGVAKVVSKRSPEVVKFIDNNEPLRNRVIPTEDSFTFRLIWDSANSVSPTMKYGPKSGFYSHFVSARTDHVKREELCDSPANESGWYDLGSIHTAYFSTKMIPDGGWFQPVYYIYGDAESDTWSEEYVFTPPPPPGSNDNPLRPTRVALLADMGIGWSESSHTFGNVEPHREGGSTFSWEGTGYTSYNTSLSLKRFIDDAQLDAVFLNGDLSYADGFLAGWNMYANMINKFSGNIVFMNTIGNHEADTKTPLGGSLLFKGTKSGGECSVVSNTLFPYPSEKAGYNRMDRSEDVMWWSKDIGLVHFIGISTEHNFSAGSPQYRWLEEDLQNVDRSVTPWVVFGGHRSLYVNSNNCCNHPKPGIPIPGPNDDVTEACDNGCNFGSDRQVMFMLQDSLEDLLYKYRVNLAFSGHLHWIQRQSAVYRNKVVQAAKMVSNSDINLGEADSIISNYEGRVALHENPQATVYTLVGTAGQGFQFRPADPTPEWNEMTMEEFGYAIITATNSTCLIWELINNVDDTILDKMVITQPLLFPPSFGMNQEEFNIQTAKKNAPLHLSSAVTMFMCLFMVIFMVMGYGLVRKRSEMNMRNPNQYTVVYDKEMTSLPVRVIRSYQSI